MEQSQGYPEPARELGFMEKLREMLGRISAPDLLSSANHSRDFRTSRAEYVSIRVRSLAFLFALLAPLWIPVDFYVMKGEVFRPIVMLRVGFSILLILLGLWSRNCNRINAARLRLALFMIIPGLFYVCSRAVLGGGLAEQGVLVGYSFLPMLMVALLAVVPLTLIEGIIYTGLAMSPLLGTEYYYGTLFSLETLGQVWMISLLGLIAIWIQLTQLHMLMRLYREATRDALTGLVNRRVLINWMSQELSSRQNSDEPLCVLLFDLDLFKRINDTYGHLAGDVVLQTFARILVRDLPEGGMSGRWGGEEFLAILPGFEREQGREAAEVIRKACHMVAVRNPDGPDTLINFTTSIGVAQWRRGENAEALLGRVDQGLYKAKASGRDFVAVAD